MKKVALVFVLAVFVPSLVLAWLAVRSLRDQQFLLERQQSLLYQGVADAVATSVQTALTDNQREFIVKVGSFVRSRDARALASTFDEVLRKDWPLAQVGFVVSMTGGDMTCPSPPYNRPEAQVFRENYSKFLSCRESAEVYWNAPKQVAENINPQSEPQQQQQILPAQVPLNRDNAPQNVNPKDVPQQQALNTQQSSANRDNNYSQNSSWNLKSKLPFTRSVSPQGGNLQVKGNQDQMQTFSKVSASDAEFCQLIGAANDGMLARFVENKLNVLCWCRPPENSRLIFGAELSLPRLIKTLEPVLTQQVDPELKQQICVALLDDTAKPVALSTPGFRAVWKHPFVATEIGENLPHWEAAVYLLDPAKLSRSAQTLKFTLGLLIALLVLAIGVGSMLIVADLNRQLTLARQKTDFVSNVSHELKTPLTSIRMFSELLAEGRVNDPAKQRNYLAIITAEAARLTRLINNVLDFARLERGEKKYKFEPCDLTKVVGETADTYRPHLEANGFQFDCELPDKSFIVNGDRDAIAQIVVNLLSNAEKYSDSRKEIALRTEPQAAPVPHVEVKILDRGLGVPDGCAEKIFEQFYRAHDSLSSGIQGSGLGLTLARQIARAHGGDLVYEPRQGGGSCFILRLPLKPA